MSVKLKKYDHLRFYALLLLLISLLFLRYSFQIEIPRILLTGTVALIAFLGTPNEIFAIAMCCIPLHEAVDVFYSIVACALALVLKNPKRIRVDQTVILGFVMIIWELLHCFDSGFSIKTYLVSIIPLIFLVIVLSTDVFDIDYGFVSRIMSVAIVAICITLLGNIIVSANYNFAVAVSSLRRLGFVSDENTIVGGSINPNSLGILCVLSITSLLQLRTVGKQKRYDVFVLIFLLVFGMLTSSRTFLVCLLLMFMLMILGQTGDVRKKVRFLISILLFIVVVLLIVSWLFPNLMEYYIKRFSAADLSTGRISLMETYSHYISDNLEVMLGGIGLHDFEHKLLETYRIAENVPHNAIQEIIVAWGIPGLAMCIALAFFMIIKSKKYSKSHCLLNYIPFIILITKSMAGQLLRSPYTMLALSFAYLSLCQVFNVSESAQNQVNNSVESNTEIL